MTKATKKELNEALRPLYAAWDRYALGFLTMPKVAEPEPIEWRGLKIKIALIRRSRTLTGVPMPNCIFEFWYELERDDKVVVQVGGRPSFIDAVFRYCARNGVELSEVQECV